MTYRDLLNALSKLSDDQLDNMDVTVYCTDMDEYYSISTVSVTLTSDILDKNHPYLTTSA